MVGRETSSSPWLFLARRLLGGWMLNWAEIGWMEGWVAGHVFRIFWRMRKFNES